jgi:hypothetical protein
VASRTSSNPVHEIGKALQLPALANATTKTLELPIKLLFPTWHGGRMMMLGLGDVALPGNEK